MKLKTSYQYQVLSLKNTVFSFYAVYFSVIVLLFCILPIFFAVSVEGGTTSLTGMEAATSIFLFIMLLEAFKEHLLMLLQNGISRRSYFLGRILAIGSIAIVMSILDSIFFFVFKKVATSLVDNFVCYNLYESIYTNRIADTGTLLNWVEQISFHAFVYMMIMSSAFLASIVYYRLGKTLRIFLCTGIPITLFMILPVVDYSIFQGRISRGISSFLNSAFGISTDQPLKGLLTLLLSTIAFTAISWLLIRKIPAKE